MIEQLTLGLVIIIGVFAIRTWWNVFKLSTYANNETRDVYAESVARSNEVKQTLGEMAGAIDKARRTLGLRDEYPTTSWTLAERLHETIVYLRTHNATSATPLGSARAQIRRKLDDAIMHAEGEPEAPVEVISYRRGVVRGLRRAGEVVGLENVLTTDTPDMGTGEGPENVNLD